MKEINENEILSHVQKLLEQQTLKGLEKYGHTVNPNEYDIVGWVDHLQQELIDALVYSTIIKIRDTEDPRQGMLEDLYAENEQLRNQLASERAHKLTYRKVSQRYQDEKNRYRKALEFYARGDIYRTDSFSYGVDLIDSGQKAHQALEDSK